MTRALVPDAFPLASAEYLRAGGIELEVDGAHFDERRRVKTPAELRGDPARDGRRRSGPGGGAVRPSRVGLTIEALRAIVRSAVEAHDVALGDFTVARGPQTATGHGPGSGPIEAGEPVIVDLWPQDRASACFSDIARTFVAGSPGPGDRGVARARRRGARGVDRARPAGRARARAVRAGVRPLRGRGLRDPTSPAGRW